jgi:hypothetical protein
VSAQKAQDFLLIHDMSFRYSRNDFLLLFGVGFGFGFDKTMGEFSQVKFIALILLYAERQSLVRQIGEMKE